MRTKICPKCGWELAYDDPIVYCPVCKTRWKEGKCHDCGQEGTLALGLYCYPCWHKRSRYRLLNEQDDAFAKWVTRATSVKNHTTLSEDQWLEACQHFNGCAVCGSPSIDSRMYFVPFKLGGRYTSWNIIPACEHCAAAYRKNPNLAHSCNHERKQNVQKIYEYLERRLDEAINNSTGSGDAANSTGDNNSAPNVAAAD